MSNSLITDLQNAFGKADLGRFRLDLKEDLRKENVYGYIISDHFLGKTNGEAQEEIWEIIKKFIPENKWTNILYVISESVSENFARVSGFVPFNQSEVWKQNFWQHKCPDGSFFWSAVDFQKINNDYKTVFLFIQNTEYVVNLPLTSSNEERKCMFFNYSKNVIDLMDFEKTEEIYPELFCHAYEQMCSENRLILMNRYQKLSDENGLWGEKNEAS